MGRFFVWLAAFFQTQKDDVTQVQDNLQWIIDWLNKNRNWLTITGMILVSFITDPYGIVSTISCKITTEALGYLPNHPQNLKLIFLLQFFDSRVSSIGSGLILEFLSFCMPAILFWPILRAAKRWI